MLALGTAIYYCIVLALGLKLLYTVQSAPICYITLCWFRCYTTSTPLNLV